jgi:hypothetical protein
VTRARALTTLALAAAVATAGCGGGEREPAGSMRWQDRPVLVRKSTLPNDRILAGTLRNDGRTRADLVARDLRLLDSRGRRVPASAGFVTSFLHGMYPPTREPRGGEPPSEQLRTGKIARVLPGKSVPLTIAWHQRPGTDPPVRIEWSQGSIPVPDEPATDVR